MKNLCCCFVFNCLFSWFELLHIDGLMKGLIRDGMDPKGCWYDKHVCFCTLDSLNRDKVTVAVGGGSGGIFGKYSAMVHWLTVEVPKVVYMVL